nr:CYP370B2 protein [Diaphanosoma celebensis]
MLVPLFIIGLLSTSAIWIWWITRRPHNFPPGPPGFFSLTTLRQVEEPLIVKVMAKLSEQYGPVVGLFLANRPFICISGYEAVRDVMLNPDLLGRPDSFVFRLRTKMLKTGILITDGDVWKEQRRFVMRHLRDFGFGKSSMEGMILDGVQDVLNDLEFLIKSSFDGHISLENLFTAAFVNITWALVAGKRIPRGDPQLEKVVGAVSGFLRATSVTGAISHFPFLRFIAPEWTGYNRLVKYINIFRSYIEEVVEEHRRAGRIGDEVRDFIDVYLNKLDSERNNAQTNFTEEQMMGIIMDLFTAGIETTSSFLGFALIYMILNPDVQTKVQEEIDSVLHGNLPSLANLTSLPYTEATLMEIQRLGIVAPIPVPHVAMENTTFQGFNIPKGTMIFVNLWSVFMDPALWADPLLFRPERHLDDRGRAVKSEYLVTFGIGKRVCLGESLAKSAIFLFFVTLMQRFRFAMPKNTSEPNLIPSPEPIPGLTFGPKPCIARISQRSAL